MLALALTLAGTAPSPATAGDDVRLMILDPGHFHAALFLRETLPGVARQVHVYAPMGPDLLGHLQRISGYNARAENPTTWALEVHASPDSFARLLAERPGNVAVLSGNNLGKIDRIEALVNAGVHVLADKPWAIEPGEFATLARVLERAAAKRVVAYDAMTQRFEISCVLPRELVNDPAVFGELVRGTAEEPAVTMESVHFLKKDVDGVPLLRPAWFFDARRLGEPLADVGTHLVDLVQWTLSPDRAIDYRKDIVVRQGSRMVEELTREQFKAVTGLTAFPADLRDHVRGDRLGYVAQNRVDYTLRGAQVRLETVWRFEAPPGGKDTELTILRGSRARVEVRQGPEEKFVPEVWVIPNRAEDRAAVEAAVRARLQRLAPGLPGLAVATEGARLRIVIPAALRVSHEAHFALVVRRFLGFRADPATMPAWETPFMLAKYFVTLEGVRLGRLAEQSRATKLSSTP
ncbi:MAG: oxidoreductase [Verrucomicrobia bacterium]|nr:oxidoreductase [Verrucomicrobiota bacterium]